MKQKNNQLIIETNKMIGSSRGSNVNHIIVRISVVGRFGLVGRLGILRIGQSNSNKSGKGDKDGDLQK